MSRTYIVSADLWTYDGAFVRTDMDKLAITCDSFAELCETIRMQLGNSGPLKPTFDRKWADKWASKASDRNVYIINIC